MNDPTHDLKSELASLDFASVSPEEFARIVKRLSPQEIREVMQGELRERVLSEIFGRMERQFRPEAAGTLDSLIRWKVAGTDGEGDAVYETRIKDGGCTVTEGRSETESRVTLIMGDAEFMKLVSGNGNPVTMFLTRKLKLVGDVGLAAGLPKYFDIPKA
ncbi:SCP2 sterol-binding domain-containing protein [Streptomyces sp. NPDC051561]|uniref:SCP2 sterol-binding domain-containing protein n=1 Tax=Streptomyces sp. NPDC051561 TaxID=3365658 RepID=UPI00379DF629